jgi:RND family efflux transporter MFP subunit
MQVGAVAEFSGRSFPGRARATEEANLSFRVSGPLIEFDVNVGDQVAKEQVVARIDPRDFEVAVDTARGTLGRAEAELAAMRIGARPEVLEQLKAAVERTQAEYDRALAEFQRSAKLVKTGAVTKAEYDRHRQLAVKARADLRTAEEDLRIGEIGAREEDIQAKESEIRSLRAGLDSAEDQLRYTYLKAPFDGVVAATYVENFETIQAKQQILRVLDTSQIEFVIDVPESLISSAQFVRDAVCIFDAFPNVEFKNVEIKEIGTEPSESTRTYPVTLIMEQLEETEGVRILPGMAGRARGRAELTEQANDQGFDIPESAVFTGTDGKQYLWLIDKESGSVKRQPLGQISLTSVGMRVKGIEAGVWIATAGVDFLSEGQQVAILSEQGGAEQ